MEHADQLRALASHVIREAPGSDDALANFMCENDVAPFVCDGYVFNVTEDGDPYFYPVNPPPYPDISLPAAADEPPNTPGPFGGTMSSVNRTLCLSEYRIALSRIKIATDELRDARECFEKAKADILALMDDDGRPVIVDGDQAFLRVAGGSVVMQPCVNSYAVRGKPPELAELAGHGGVAYSDDDTAALVA